MAIFLLQLCFFENQAQAMIANSLSPADEATDVAVDSNLVINFNDTWVPTPSESGTIQLRKGDGTLVESYSFPSYPANITGQGTNNLTIDPSSDLLPSTSYYVTVDDLIIQSSSGMNVYHGITNSTTWNFTTVAGGCYNPPVCVGPCFSEDPTILHKSPPDGAHFMQSYEGLNIILDRTVTVGSGNITIRRYSDDVVFETIDVTSNRVTGWGTNSINIDLVGNLADNTHYYVNLDLTNYATTADKDMWDFWTKAKPNTFSGAGL